MSKYLNDHYRDRGMKKWAGFYLSEHSLEQEKYAAAQLNINKQKPQMELYDIGQVLEEARLKNKQVTIQLEAVDNEGNYFDDVVGYLKGADAMGIYINQEKIHFDEIRHACLVESQKWSAL